MENTVASKLEALQKLQSIDSEIDELKKVRGALPEEIMDLEDEIAGYDTRVDKQTAELQEMEEGIEANKVAIKDAEKLIKEDLKKEIEFKHESYKLMGKTFNPSKPEAYAKSFKISRV